MIRKDGGQEHYPINHLWNMGNNATVTYKYYNLGLTLGAGDGVTLEKITTLTHLYSSIFDGTFGPEAVKVLTQAQYDALTTKKNVFYLISDA